jgi:hypothetical protein
MMVKFHNDWEGSTLAPNNEPVTIIVHKDQLHDMDKNLHHFLVRADKRGVGRPIS